MGRAWLYREISDHLCSDLPTNRGVIVAGAAGSGKTAVVLQLVENSCFGRGEFATQELQSGQRCSSPSMSMLDRHDGMDSIYSVRSMVSSTSTFNYSSLKSLSAQVVAYHFCQSDNAPTCLVPEFVHSVAAQMSQAPQLIPYYQLIASDSFLQQRLSLAGCVADPSSALVDGILKPLGSLKRLGKLPSNVTCVVVIDGLCDAETHRPDYGDTIAGFLSKHLLKFPTWLKLVCTVRTGRQEITKLLPFQKISLDKADVDERLNKDVSDYIMHRIQKSPTVLANITPKSSCKMEVDAASRFTRYVVAAAEGCFLYARMMLDLVERGHLVIKSSSFNVLPLSLAEIFTLEFSLKFPSGRSFDKVKDILAVALASLVPMTPSEIFNSANALVASNEFGNSEQQPLQWGEFLIRFSALSELLVRRADDTVMFFHPSLREWLIRRNCDRNRKFLCDPKVGHAAIAFRMSSQETPLSPDKTLELGHHILKAHIYKNVLQVRNDEANNIPSRDLHAIWLGLSSSDVSKSLGSVRNISSPNVKVSRLLLLSGADPDHRVADCLGGAPLLCIYAHLGHADMVAALLEFGADVGACNTAESVGALTFAAAKGHLDIVQTLLHHGAPVNGVDKTDVSALVAASRSGHLDVVGHLVSNCEWQTDAVLDLGLDEAAQQAMVAASSCGHDQVLEFLLDMSEVKVDLPDTLLGRTGLCAAASNGNLKCAEILLRRRAKVSTTDLEGTPALHLAVSSGHWQATELLIKEGASLEQTDSFGRTPLMAAAREGHAGLVELLCNKGGRHLLEARDKEGNTPLIWASRSAKPAAAAALLDAGADVSHGDSGGRTPLDHAVAHVANDEDSYDTVRLLMERGAELERVDVDGRRPLDRAIECGNTRALQAFLRKGAKLGPATWAVASNKPDIMLILLNKLLEDGNTLYKRNKFQDAAHRYVYAVRRLPVTNNNVKKMTSIEEEEQLRHENLFQQLKIHLLLNLSRCQRKMGEWKKAIETATQVIEDCHLRSNPSSQLSALHARAKTFKESGQLEKAGQDLTEALKLSPHNRDLHRLILKVKEDMRKSEEEEESGGDCPKQELEEDAPLLQPVGIGTGEKFSFLDETVTQS